MTAAAGDVTLDQIPGTDLMLRQPRHGYRFSLDALLLADFAAARPGSLAVDLGTGCGVVALMLARKMGRGRVTAVEIQPGLAALARENIATNAGAVEMDVLETDWREITGAVFKPPADLVVCNPPYRRLGSGRINPNPEAAAARHELLGRLDSACQAAARILGKGGHLTLVYPAVRLSRLFTDVAAAGFAPKRLRLVHSRAGESAVLALMEARLEGGESLAVLPPLCVYGPGREYTDEARGILYGGAEGL